MPSREPRVLGTGRTKEEASVYESIRKIHRNKRSEDGKRQSWTGQVITAGATITLRHRIGETPWVVLRPTGTDVVSTASRTDITLTSAAGATVDVLAWAE